MFKTNKELLRRAEHYLYLKPLSAVTAINTIAGNSAAVIKVWQAITHRSRLTKGGEIRLTTELCRMFGIEDRKVKDAGLKILERAGVCRVRRQNGKNPVVILNTEFGTVERRVTLTMNQVRSISGTLGNIAEFNEGDQYTARAFKDAHIKKLKAADKSGDTLDIDLVDYGTGWLVAKIRPPSKEWKRPELRVILAANEPCGGIPALRQPQPPSMMHRPPITSAAST